MPFIGTTPRQGFSNHIASQNLSANVDGSTTVFTLSTAVASENDLEVFVGNVRQEPGSSKAYTASGTTLTFTEAPANGLNVYVNYKGQAQITSIPQPNLFAKSFITFFSALSDANEKYKASILSFSKIDTNVFLSGGLLRYRTISGDIPLFSIISNVSLDLLHLGL